MKLEISDEHVNALMVDTIKKLVEHLKHAHYTDITVKSRINGGDTTFQADWLKHLRLVP